MRFGAAYVIDHQRPNLLFVRFSSLDLAQRIDGPESKTAQSALVFIDTILPTITEAIARADFQTTLLIISNRGAMKATKAFNPNVVLAKKGLISVDRAGHRLLEGNGADARLGRRLCSRSKSRRRIHGGIQGDCRRT